MAQLKFYKQAVAPAAVTEGAIWFDTTNHIIQVKVAEGWDKYAGALNDATWADNTLTITKHDGSSIALNFSDMASAAAMKAIFTDKFGLNADMSYTGVYAVGNTVRADIVATKAATDTVASALEGVSGRVETIETLLNEDTNDTIDNLRDVIDYFNGVKETDTGAALLNTVAGHNTTIGNLKSAAFTDSTDYATAAQGATADTALANAATAQGRADDAYALADTKRTETQVNDAIIDAINALKSEASSTDGSYVTVKVTIAAGKVTAVNVEDSAVKTYVEESLSWAEFE